MMKIQRQSLLAASAIAGGMLAINGCAEAQTIGAPQPIVAGQVESAMHDGKVVSVEGMRLTMTDKEGRKHFHTLSDSTKLLLDGETCEAKQMEPGSKVRVTTAAENPMQVTEVECLDKNDEFAIRRHEGKLVSIDNKNVVITSSADKERETSSITEGTKFVCDGKPCESSDLKPGMEIRVTSERDKHKVAAKVEALDKKSSFVATLR